MIYDIRHLTLYEYGSTVTFSRCALRLLPADGAGQTVLSSELSVTPTPAQTIERMCFFGSRLSFLTIEIAHRNLIVEVNTSVAIDRSERLDEGATPAFEKVREDAFTSASLDKDSPAHFLHPSRLAPRFEPASDYA
ncbi:MAG: transglutaminase N-terminal domain-containing protein, partial [Methylocella sp.]